jgi:hypothetical protein
MDLSLLFVRSDGKDGGPDAEWTRHGAGNVKMAALAVLPIFQ